jgi:hypothetical protein
MNGNDVIRRLRGLTDGESVIVNGIEWTSLGLTFAAPADANGNPHEDGEASIFVARDDLDDYFKPELEYEAVG